MRGIIKHKEYEIEYFTYGSGPKPLIAFHGFNNNASEFKPLGDFAGNEYFIIAINIFFHGDSHAVTNLVEKGFSMDDLKELFNEIKSLRPSEKYTLLGYSLGGRIVLKLLEVFPEEIEAVILLAPDGIRISPYYRMLTQTSIGRRLLKRVVDKPKVLLFGARLLKKSGILSRHNYKFGLSNFDSRAKREMVYKVWMTLRMFIPDKKVVKDLLKKHHIHLHLFFGKYDRIIPTSIGRKFSKGSEEFITLNVLETGHHLLKEKNLQEVARIIIASD